MWICILNHIRMADTFTTFVHYTCAWTWVWVWAYICSSTIIKLTNRCFCFLEYIKNCNIFRVTVKRIGFSFFGINSLIALYYSQIFFWNESIELFMNMKIDFTAKCNRWESTRAHVMTDERRILWHNRDFLCIHFTAKWCCSAGNMSEFHFAWFI